MAIKLTTKPNTTGPSGEYPFGDIRDRNVGLGVAGTPVSREVYADFHQFFEKMMSYAGIVHNDLPDNAYDGFQLMDALLQVISSSLVNLLDYKGNFSASGNPNYPSALVGDSYRISVAGKIGGASGKDVFINDIALAISNNAGGTEASVGTSWIIISRQIVFATESVSGILEVATQSETNSGTSDTRIVTPLKLYNSPNVYINVGGAFVSDLNDMREGTIIHTNGSRSNAPTANVGDEWIVMTVSSGISNGDTFQTATQITGTGGSGLGTIYRRKFTALGTWSAWTAINT